MPHYYPLWIAAGGHNVIRRGPDCDTPAGAAAIIKDKLAHGYASLGIVVKVDAGRHDVMSSSIYPPSAKRVIGHYEDILTALDRAENLTREE